LFVECAVVIEGTVEMVLRKSSLFPKIVTLENIAILGMDNAGRGCPSHNEELLTSQGWWTCCWSGGHDHGHSLGRDAHMDLLQACLTPR
jgi:hypothetical protein